MIFLCPGHRIFPSMVGDYLRLTWLAERARVPGELQLLAQAVWEAGPTPKGPMGRALRVAHRLGWTPTQGWWEWRIPMQQHPLSFLQGSWGSLCHAIRDALRFAAAHRLAAGLRPRSSSNDSRVPPSAVSLLGARSPASVVLP